LNIRIAAWQLTLFDKQITTGTRNKESSMLIIRGKALFWEPPNILL